MKFFINLWHKVCGMFFRSNEEKITKLIVTAPVSVPVMRFRLVKYVGRGRLRVPREAATIGTKIAYPLHGCCRGLGVGTVIGVSGGRVCISVKRKDGKIFTVRHRIA